MGADSRRKWTAEEKLQILDEARKAGQSVSEVCRRFEPTPQILRNVRAGREGLEQDCVKAAIDAGRVRLGANGRLVIRPSGTEPVIRVMGEGDNRDLVEDVVRQVCEALKTAAAAA